jgi:hypothetical protein
MFRDLLKTWQGLWARKARLVDPAGQLEQSAPPGENERMPARSQTGEDP